MNKSCFFVITILLLTTHAYAAPSVAKSYHVKKFEMLVKAALVEQKSSVAKRATVGVLREIVRIGGFELLWKYHLNKANIFYLALASFLCVPPLFADYFVGRLGASKDKSLDALQKLEKYASTLTSEQKQKISELFEQRYEPLLNAKILNEKDSQSIQFTRLAVALIDLCWILRRVGPEATQLVNLWIKSSKHPTFSEEHHVDCSATIKVPVYINYKDYESGTVIQMQEVYDDGTPVFENKQMVTNTFLNVSHLFKAAAVSLIILAVLDSWLVASNFKNSSDRQKVCILQKIKKTLSNNSI